MRFALAAAVGAALVAVPLAVAATGPQMSSDEFLTAVRCTAHEAASGAPRAALAEAKYELNSEARRQPVETAVQALAEARAIARQAVIGESGADAANLSACADAQLTADANGRRAV
jgi:hypothetical protein